MFLSCRKACPNQEGDNFQEVDDSDRRCVPQIPQPTQAAHCTSCLEALCWLIAIATLLNRTYMGKKQPACMWNAYASYQTHTADKPF